MRDFQMSVVERRERFAGEFTTQPFEAAWASEAIFFVRIEEIEPAATLTVQVQLSADGIRWVDEGSGLGPVGGTDDHFVRVAHFGGWLRLRGAVEGADRSAVLTVQLALKG